MSPDVYTQLAKFLDNLPGGFPATESGVELKILSRLFTPQEAELAQHLALLAEPPRVIAHRAKKPLEEVAAMLAQMEKKGLVYARHKDGHEPQYTATHFVVGIYEFQLNKMDVELASLFEEYLPQVIDFDIWKEAPQIRTIPVGESINADVSILDYERAENLINAHTKFSVAPCICRQEKEILGEPCDKPLETCMSFGSGADFYVRNEMGRYITKEEALEILRVAEENALVLQPSAYQQASFICTCCGCCCGVLTNLKRHPSPADIALTPFFADHDDDLCDGCELCLDRCQMDALMLDNGIIHVDRHRCIGCGLCVTTCPNEALTLVRKPDSELRKPKRTSAEMHIHLAKTRGVLNNLEMAGLVLRSQRDRALSSRSD